MKSYIFSPCLEVTKQLPEKYSGPLETTRYGAFMTVARNSFNLNSQVFPSLTPYAPCLHMLVPWF